MANVTKHSYSESLDRGVRERIDCLMRLNSKALQGFREFLSMRGFVEVTPSTLGEVTSLYGPTSNEISSLDSFSQIQLEALTACFGRSYFVIGSSRDEDASICMSAGSRMSTSLEGVLQLNTLDNALERVLCHLEDLVKHALREVLDDFSDELDRLGGDLNFLGRIMRRPFVRISYEEALHLLNDRHNGRFEFGDILGPREEREILSYFCNIPTFISLSPASLANGSVQRFEDSRQALGTKLLLPRQGASGSGFILNARGSRDDRCRSVFRLCCERFTSFVLGSSLA